MVNDNEPLHDKDIMRLMKTLQRSTERDLDLYYPQLTKSEIRSKIKTLRMLKTRYGLSSLTLSAYDECMRRR